MRKISVVLDHIASAALDKLLESNQASISDIVNAGIMAIAYDDQPVFPIVNEGLFEKLRRLKNITEWCKARGIDRKALYSLCQRVDQGKEIRGLGDSNRWRDRQNERLYRTHTAWIAHCIREDFGIDLT